jgi:hypothetical protein
MIKDMHNPVVIPIADEEKAWARRMSEEKNELDLQSKVTTAMRKVPPRTIWELAFRQAFAPSR